MRILLVMVIFCLIVFTPFVYAHSQTQVIKMTANGFDPQNIMVDENTTVFFVNEDKTDHWPASDIHPTHEIYPEFDPKKPIAGGQSWSFKPHKVGSFKFHDHLFPHFRGLMIVKQEQENTPQVIDSAGSTPAPKKNLFTKIKDLISKLLEKIGFKSAPKQNGETQSFTKVDLLKLSPQDQINFLKDSVKHQGSKETWEYFKQSFLGQSGSEGNIHDLAHLMGSLIYENLGFSGLAVCSSEYAFGCYHGFLDKAFEKSLDQLPQAEEACSSLDTSHGGPFASCIHGVGHGIASFYQTSDLRSALLSCQKLKFGDDYCYDGVFMEFERAAPNSFYSSDDPEFPCDRYEREFGPIFSFSCGRNQTVVMMDRLKLSYEAVIGICLKSFSSKFQAACFDSLGFAVVRATLKPQDIIEGCKKIGVLQFIARCTKAAAGELIFQEASGWQEKAPLVCQSLPQNYQIECLQYLDELSKQYGRGSIRNFSLLQQGEDYNDYLRKELKICFGDGGREGCYKKVADLFYSQFGLKKTLELLKNNEQYQEVYARCHEVTHYLSRSEFQKVGNIAKVYSQCDSTCHGGCYHGTLEAYLKSKGLDEEGLKQEFIKVCGEKNQYSAPIVFNECLHGLGHAAMFVTEMDLPKSLALCDTVMDQDGKERCFSGVFMENSSSSTSNDHQSKFVKADDPYYPCNSLKEKYQRICWRYQSSYFSIITNNDWPKIVNLCLKIPDQYKEECFRTIGTNQVGFTQDLIKMKSDCALSPLLELKNVCIAGVISSFAYRFVGDIDKMIHFCEVVDDDSKKSCYKQMGAAFSDWTTNKDEIKSNCNQISDPKGLFWCLSSIDV